MQRLIAPSLIGVAGVSLLVALGLWQLQRLEWKSVILTQIEQRILDHPIPLPAQPDRDAFNFAPVEVVGETVPGNLFVLVSRPGIGPGYRRIVPLKTGERRILLDQGFVPDRHPSSAGVRLEVIGNLHWPDEFDSWFTPEPDGDLWFARDVEAMAASLATEPVMIVARSLAGPVSGVTPWPVGTAGIPNDHLEYAITWFALAVAWSGMTVFWLLRRHKNDRQAGSNGLASDRPAGKKTTAQE